MKKVLVPLATTTFAPDAKVEIEFVRQTYVRKLVDQGLTPIFVSSLLPLADVMGLYEECAGMFLTGGTDLDPAHYGAPLDPHTRIAEPLRDKLELALVRRVLDTRKPFLGICRGLQVLNVAAGGTLIQHLPDAVPDEAHGVSEGRTYDELLAQEGHEVLLAAGSRIRELVGTERLRMNSGHHQAVERPGGGLRISGVSPRGVVEVMEHEDPHFFCFGVQGHPECSRFAAGANTYGLDRLFNAFAAVIMELT